NLEESGYKVDKYEPTFDELAKKFAGLGLKLYDNVPQSMVKRTSFIVRWG
ncbi:MAG: hypothetical protein Satyrvirus22_1, partial [Satyrvirus sp.]